MEGFLQYGLEWRIEVEAETDLGNARLMIQIQDERPSDVSLQSPQSELSEAEAK